MNTKQLIERVASGVDPIDLINEESKGYSKTDIAELLHKSATNLQDATANLHEILIASAEYSDQIGELASKLDQYAPVLFELSDKIASDANTAGWAEEGEPTADVSAEEPLVGDEQA